MDSPKVFFEPQVGRDERGFWLTVTISTGNSYRTSGQARLTAGTWEEAKTEASEQVRALMKVCRG